MAHVVAGTWDYDKGPAMMKAIDEAKRAIHASVNTDAKIAFELLTKLDKEYPLATKGLDSLRFSILARLPEHVTAATDLGRKMVEKAIAAVDATALNDFAWNLVDPQVSLENRFLELALLAADKANELTHDKNAAVLTLTPMRTRIAAGVLSGAGVIVLAVLGNFLIRASEHAGLYRPPAMTERPPADPERSSDLAMRDAG